MRLLLLSIAAGLLATLSVGVGTSVSAQNPGCEDCLRLNDIQVLGTHNSYHLAPYPELLKIIEQYEEPDTARSFAYSHRPLGDQLGVLGIRQVELDIWADPGPTPLFASPLGEAGINGPDSVPISGLLAPGEKVLHIQDIDYRTTCLTLVVCLQQIEDWSATNPNHLPILILLEAKDATLALPAGFPPATVPVPIGAAELQSIDDVIRSIFGPGQMITPDEVRGSHATLEEAILKDGWPTLDAARGRVLFALDNPDAKRDAYIAGHPSLEGRVMFTNSDPGTPEAAFVEMNDPVANLTKIQALVAMGYLVRTRADEDTAEARAGDTARRDAALASGAQFVSTDYPEPDPALGTGYSVSIPGGRVARCNPILTVAACNESAFEPRPALVPTATVASPAPTATVAPPAAPRTGQGLVAKHGEPGLAVVVVILVALAAMLIGGHATVRLSHD